MKLYSQFKCVSNGPFQTTHIYTILSYLVEGYPQGNFRRPTIWDILAPMVGENSTSNMPPDSNGQGTGQKAIDEGLDIGQLDYLQSLTPTERFRRHEQALALVRALRQAGIRYYGFDPRYPETPAEPRG